MVVLSIAFASLLLTSSALAAPTIKSRNTLEKKGFRVAVHRRAPKLAVTKRDTGDVAATSDSGQWIIPVLIGGQQVTLNVDTGSSDIWTASTLLPSDQQSEVTTGELYDPSQSSNSQEMDGETFTIEYADGSSASGPVYTDTVDVGGATVPNMPFGAADSLVITSSTGTRDTDGPLGLGFGNQNTFSPTPQCTFMECLEPYVPDPIFSTAFKLDNSGYIEFGYSDTSSGTGDVTTIPIANTSTNNLGQWVNQGVQFGSGGNVFSSAPMDMDFDTGTPTLSLPADAASEYFALVSGSAQSGTSYTYPCGATLPDFDFVFTQVTSGPTTVTIPGDSIKNGDGTGTCGTWVDVVTGRANAGLPFYISKYMIWNQATPSLSFNDQVGVSNSTLSRRHSRVRV